MSQKNLETMIMQNFGGGGGVKEVYYGIVQVVNWIVQIPAPLGQNGVQMPYPIVGFCLTDAPPRTIVVGSCRL